MTISLSFYILNAIPCFSDLDAETTEIFLKNARQLHLTRGEFLLREGEECPGLFIWQSGSVKLFRTSPSGAEQIMRVIRAGGCFDCAPLFDHGPNPVSAQTLESSRALFIPAASFESLVRDRPETTLKIVPVLAMRLRDFLNTIEDLSFRPVAARINKLILQMGQRVSQDQTESSAVPLTQYNLACIVGCSRQVLNGYLRKLVKKGVIRLEKRRIILLDPEALVELADTEPDDIEEFS